MSNVPHKRLQLSKRSLKLSGQTYAVQQKKLERVLAEQLEDLELKENAIGAGRTREQVLADFITHQELVLGLLEQQQGWLAALSENKEAKQHLEQEQLGAATFEGNCSSPVLSEAAQRGVSGAGLSDVGRAKDLQLLGGPSVPPVAAAGAAAAGLQDPERQQQQQPDTSGSLSYVAGLLVNATPAQLRRVMDMTAEDWQQYKHDHFMRLVALLELVNRPSCSHDTEDDMPDEQQQQQQQGSLSQKPVARSQPASGSSGASGNTTAMPAGEQDLLPPAAAAAAATSAGAPGSGLELFDIPRRFQDVVDEGITLSFLALFFNHLSIIHASTNADLPQQAAPQSLWLRVVRKLNLTSQQLLQLRLASEEFTRLNRSCSQEAETLMGRANRPSLLLAAEASIQAAASASATAGSGSSASVSRASSSAGVPVSGSGADSSSKGTSAGAAVAPAAAAAAADEDAAAESEAATDDEEHEELDDLLQRHLRLRFLYMVMIGMFVFNTLTRVQIAQMTVSCYPFYPMLTAVAEAAATLHKQQQQEDEQRIRAKRRQRQTNEDFQLPEQGDDDADDDSSCSSSYARQQLQQHQQQRNRLLQLQQAFWQQQLKHGWAPMQP